MCVGMPVHEDGLREPIGSIDGILLHPDNGRVEGFFVAVPGFFDRQRLFLSVNDVEHFGRRVTVRDAETLSQLDDHVRLLPLMNDPRRILGQPMVTDAGRPLGRCADVQFDTNAFQLQWLFPKRFFLFWGPAISAQMIVEVKREEIVVREQTITVPDEPTVELVPPPPTPA